MPEIDDIIKSSQGPQIVPKGGVSVNGTGTTIDEIIKGTAGDQTFRSGDVQQHGNLNDFDFIKYPGENPQHVLSRSQSMGEKLGKAALNIVPNITLGIAETVGIMGEGLSYLFDQNAERDFSNWLTEFSQQNRNVFGEVHELDPGTINWTDPSFWINQGAGLVESIAEFGIVGMGAGSVLRKGAGLLANSIAASGTVARGISGASTIANSALLAYTEGAMSGATVYQEVLNATGDKELAGKAAVETVKLNTGLNTLLNLSSLAPLTKLGRVKDSVKTGIARKSTLKGVEETKDYMARLREMSPEFTGTVRKKMLFEAPQESLEELINVASEAEGRQVGGLEKNTDFVETLINAAKSDEGILSMALGAVGGAGQTVLVEGLAPKRVPKYTTDPTTGKKYPMMEGDKMQTEKVLGYKAIRQELAEEFHGARNAILEDLTAVENYKQQLIDIAADEKMSESEKAVKSDEIKNSLFDIAARKSVANGTADNLIQTYKEISELDNVDFLDEKILQGLASAKDDTEKAEIQKQAKEVGHVTAAMKAGLSYNPEDNEFKETAQETIQYLEQLKKDHDDIFRTHNYGDGEAFGYADHLYQVTAAVRSKQGLINKYKKRLGKASENWGKTHQDRKRFATFMGPMVESHTKLVASNRAIEQIDNETSSLIEGLRSDDPKVRRATKQKLKAEYGISQYGSTKSIEKKLTEAAAAKREILNEENQRNTLDFNEMLGKEFKDFLEDTGRLKNSKIKNSPLNGIEGDWTLTDHLTAVWNELRNESAGVIDDIVDVDTQILKAQAELNTLNADLNKARSRKGKREFISAVKEMLKSMQPQERVTANDVNAEEPAQTRNSEIKKWKEDWDRDNQLDYESEPFSKQKSIVNAYKKKVKDAIAEATQKMAKVTDPNDREDWESVIESLKNKLSLTDLILEGIDEEIERVSSTPKGIVMTKARHFVSFKQDHMNADQKRALAEAFHSHTKEQLNDSVIVKVEDWPEEERTPPIDATKGNPKVGINRGYKGKGTQAVNVYFRLQDPDGRQRNVLVGGFTDPRQWIVDGESFDGSVAHFHALNPNFLTRTKNGKDKVVDNAPMAYYTVAKGIMDILDSKEVKEVNSKELRDLGVHINNGLNHDYVLPEFRASKTLDTLGDEFKVNYKYKNNKGQEVTVDQATVVVKASQIDMKTGKYTPTFFVGQNGVFRAVEKDPENPDMMKEFAELEKKLTEATAKNSKNTPMIGQWRLLTEIGSPSDPYNETGKQFKTTSLNYPKGAEQKGKGEELFKSFTQSIENHKSNPNLPYEILSDFLLTMTSTKFNGKPVRAWDVELHVMKGGSPRIRWYRSRDEQEDMWLSDPSLRIFHRDGKFYKVKMKKGQAGARELMRSYTKSGENNEDALNRMAETWMKEKNKTTLPFTIVEVDWKEFKSSINWLMQNHPRVNDKLLSAFGDDVELGEVLDATLRPERETDGKLQSMGEFEMYSEPILGVYFNTNFKKSEGPSDTAPKQSTKTKVKGEGPAAKSEKLQYRHNDEAWDNFKEELAEEVQDLYKDAADILEDFANINELIEAAEAGVEARKNKKKKTRHQKIAGSIVQAFEDELLTEYQYHLEQATGDNSLEPKDEPKAEPKKKRKKKPEPEPEEELGDVSLLDGLDGVEMATPRSTKTQDDYLKSYSSGDSGKNEPPPFKIGSGSSGFNVDLNRRKANLAGILPSEITVEDLNNLHRNVTASEGEVWGLFMDKSIYLATNAKPGTEYHEAFHAVFRTLMSPGTVARLYKYGRKKWGVPPKDDIDRLSRRPGHENLTKEELENLYYEEMMADEFMDFMEKRKPPSEHWLVRPFMKILNWIRFALFGDAYHVYDNIARGAYKSKYPVVRKTNSNMAFKLLKTVDPVTKKQVHLDKDVSDRIINTVTRFAVDKARKYTINVGTKENPEYRPSPKAIPDKEEIMWAINNVKQKLHKDLWQEELDQINRVDANKAYSIQRQMEMNVRALGSPENVDSLLKEVRNRSVWYGDIQEVKDALSQLEDYEQEGGPNLVEQLKDIAEVGGFTSLPNALRTFMALSLRSVDIYGFGSGIYDPDNSKYHFAADPAVIYNFLARALQDVPRNKLLQKLAQKAKDNPEVTSFYHSLVYEIHRATGKPTTEIFEEIETAEQLDLDEYRKSPIYNMFEGNFHKGRLVQTIVMYDAGSHKFKVIKANQRNAANEQVGFWQKRFSGFQYTDKDQLRTVLDNISTAIGQGIADVIVEPDKMDDNISAIQLAFQKLGVELSRGYIRYSLIQPHIEDISTTLKGLTRKDRHVKEYLTELRDFYFGNYNKSITILTDDSNFKAGKGFFYELATSTANIETMFYAQQDKSDKTTEKATDTGALSRLKKMAHANAMFDENVGENSFQNAAGKQQYEVVSHTYYTTEFRNWVDSAVRQNMMDELTAQFGKDGLDKPAAIAYAKKFFETEEYPMVDDYLFEKYYLTLVSHPWLVELDQDERSKLFKNMEMGAINGIQAQSLVENKFDELEVAKYKQSKTGKTWKDQDHRSKLLTGMTLFADHKYRDKKPSKGAATIKKDSGDPYASFIVGVNADKSTNFHVQMRVWDYFGNNGPTKLAIRHMTRHLETEYKRIQRESTRPQEGNTIKGYHTGKNPRALEFFYFHIDRMLQAHPNGEVKVGDTTLTFEEVLNKLQTAARDNNDFSEHEKLAEAFVTAYMNAEFSNFLDEISVDSLDLATKFEESKENPFTLLEKKYGTSIGANLIPNYFLTKSGSHTKTIKIGDRHVKPVHLQRLGQFFLNDLINTMSFNTLMDGDLALGHKNPEDVFKRNAGKIAAGITMGDGTTSFAIVSPPKWSVEESEVLRHGVNAKDFEDTDGQVFTGVEWFKKTYLRAMGKNHDEIVKILQKVRRGVPLSSTDNYLLSKHGAKLDPLKLVQRDRFTYTKMSLAFLTRELTSYTEYPGLVNFLYDKLEEAEESGSAMMPLSYASPEGKYVNVQGGGRRMNPQEIMSMIHAEWRPIPGKENLHDMLNRMETEEVDWIVFDSASKLVSKNIGEVTGTWSKQLMHNSTIREQVNTEGYKDKITHPTQLMQLIWSEQYNDLKVPVKYQKEPADLGDVVKRYRRLLGARVEMSFDKYLNSVIDGDGDPIYKVLGDVFKASIAASDGDARLTDFFETTGERRKFNWNMPHIEAKAGNMWLSHANKSVFNQKVSGLKLTLTSDWGYNPMRVVERINSLKEYEEAVGKSENVYEENGEYYRIVSTIHNHDFRRNPRPQLAKGQMLKPIRLRHRIKDTDGNYYTEIAVSSDILQHYGLSRGDTIPDELIRVMGSRIPGQDKHSMINAKIVDILPSHYGNAMMQAREMTWLSGEDFDIDSKYLQTKQVMTFKGALQRHSDNKPWLYGDYMKMEGSAAYRAAYDEWLNEIQHDPLVKWNIDQLIDEEELTVTQILEGDASYLEKYKETVEAALEELGETYPSNFESFLKKYRVQIDKNLSGEEYNPITKAELNNHLLDLQTVLLHNEGNKEIAATPASRDLITEMEDYLYNPTNPVDPDVRPGLGLPRPNSLSGVNSATDKFRGFSSVLAGAKGIGIVARFNVAFQLFADAKMKIREKEINDASGDPEANIAAGMMFMGKKGFEPKTVENAAGLLSDDNASRINDIISTIITVMVDNPKFADANKFNLVESMLNTFLGMVGMGTPPRLALAFMIQPSIKYYSDQKVNINTPIKTGADDNKYTRYNAVENTIAKFAVTDAEWDVEPELDITESNMEAAFIYSLHKTGSFTDIHGDKITIDDNVYNLYQQKLFSEFMKAENLMSKMRDFSNLLKLSRTLGKSWGEVDVIEQNLENIGIEVKVTRSSRKDRRIPYNFTLVHTQDYKDNPANYPFNYLDVINNSPYLKASLDAYMKTNYAGSQFFILNTPTGKSIIKAIKNNTDKYTWNQINNAKLRSELLGYLSMRAYRMTAWFWRTKGYSHESVRDIPRLNENNPMFAQDVDGDSILFNILDSLASSERFKNNSFLKFLAKDVTDYTKQNKKNHQLFGMKVFKLFGNTRTTGDPTLNNKLADAFIELQHAQPVDPNNPDDVALAERARNFSRLLFDYLLIKDAGLYKSGSFIRQVDPETFRLMSQALDMTQAILSGKEYVFKDEERTIWNTPKQAFGSNLNSLSEEFIQLFLRNPTNSVMLGFLDIGRTLSKVKKLKQAEEKKETGKKKKIDLSRMPIEIDNKRDGVIMIDIWAGTQNQWGDTGKLTQKGKDEMSMNSQALRETGLFVRGEEGGIKFPVIFKGKTAENAPTKVYQLHKITTKINDKTTQIAIANRYDPAHKVFNPGVDMIYRVKDPETGKWSGWNRFFKNTFVDFKDKGFAEGTQAEYWPVNSLGTFEMMPYAYSVRNWHTFYREVANRETEEILVNKPSSEGVEEALDTVVKQLIEIGKTESNLEGVTLNKWMDQFEFQLGLIDTDVRLKNFINQLNKRGFKIPTAEELLDRKIARPQRKVVKKKGDSKKEGFEGLDEVEDVEVKDEALDKKYIDQLKENIRKAAEAAGFDGDEVVEDYSDEFKLIKTDVQLKNVIRQINNEEEFEIPTAEEMLGREIKRNRGAQLESTRPILPKEKAELMLNKLSRKFGIEWEYSEDLEPDQIAAFREGRVLINPHADIHEDTPFHEFLHPFVRVLKDQHPGLYNKLIRDMKNSKLGRQVIRQVRRKYGFENESDIMEEALVTVTGWVAADQQKEIKALEGSGLLATIKRILKRISEYINSLIEDPAKKITVEELGEFTTIDDIATLMNLENEVFLPRKSGNFFTGSVNDFNIQNRLASIGFTKACN